MTFNISGFTHIGTERKQNHDAILINGEVISQECFFDLHDQSECVCFVADGMGINSGSGIASKFILEKICQITYTERMKFLRDLIILNDKLHQELSKHGHLGLGAGTTLTGIIAKESIFEVFHAGDSQIWLLRNMKINNQEGDYFYKITNDQCLPNERDTLTSYYGGPNEILRFDNQIKIKNITKGDYLVICTDGLFKAISTSQVKTILLEKKLHLNEKSQNILSASLTYNAPDNLSVILIEII